MGKRADSTRSREDKLLLLRGERMRALRRQARGPGPGARKAGGRPRTA